MRTMPCTSWHYECLHALNLKMGGKDKKKIGAQLDRLTLLSQAKAKGVRGTKVHKCRSATFLGEQCPHCRMRNNSVHPSVSAVSTVSCKQSLHFQHSPNYSATYAFPAFSAFSTVSTFSAGSTCATFCSMSTRAAFTFYKFLTFGTLNKFSALSTFSEILHILCIQHSRRRSIRHKKRMKEDEKKKKKNNKCETFQKGHDK